MACLGTFVIRVTPCEVLWVGFSGSGFGSASLFFLSILCDISNGERWRVWSWAVARILLFIQLLYPTHNLEAASVLRCHRHCWQRNRRWTRACCPVTSHMLQTPTYSFSPMVINATYIQFHRGCHRSWWDDGSSQMLRHSKYHGTIWLRLS